jgi:hypothetical protein
MGSRRDDGPHERERLSRFLAWRRVEKKGPETPARRSLSYVGAVAWFALGVLTLALVGSGQRPRRGPIAATLRPASGEITRPLTPVEPASLPAERAASTASASVSASRDYARPERSASGRGVLSAPTSVHRRSIRRNFTAHGHCRQGQAVGQLYARGKSGQGDCSLGEIAAATGRPAVSGARPPSDPLSHQRAVYRPPPRHESRKDGRVHRLRRPGRIAVLAQERDLPRRGAQEHHALLTVDTSGRLDPPLAVDLRDGGLRVGEGLDPQSRRRRSSGTRGPPVLNRSRHDVGQRA